MEVSRLTFVKVAYEKILSFRDARKSKLLVTSATSVIAKIDEAQKTGGKVQVSSGELALPLKLACEAKNWKVTVLALDCLQKLLSFGVVKETEELEGWPQETESRTRAPDTLDHWADSSAQSKARMSLMDHLVQSISACFVGPESHEAVEFHVVKTLLSVVTSPGCDLHGQNLLAAIRTCYNIYLLSQTQVNQQTARGTLTQMVNAVFHRLEGQMEKTELETHHRHDPDKMSIRSETVGHADHPDSFGFSRRSSFDASPPPASHDIPEEGRRGSYEFWENQQQQGQQQQHEEGGAAGDGPANESPAITASGNGNGNGNGDGNENGSASGNETLPAHDEQDEAIQIETSINAIEMSETELDQSFLEHKSLDDLNDHTPIVGITPALPLISELEEPFHKDGYLILRALCRLSIKPVSELSLMDPNSIAMRSKLLSLQLLLFVLQNTGPSFQRSEIFISGIKKYLIVSLCSNASFKDKAVFSLVSQMFLIILNNYPAHLKYEIEVCFKEMFFKLLESRQSTQEQKMLVLEALKKLCAMPQKLVDIFINYDCDPEALDSNVFEKIVDDLSKIVQMKPEPDPQAGNTLPDDTRLKIMGLECIIEILNSMVTWSKDTETPEATEEVKSEEGGHDQKDDPLQFEQIKHHKQALVKGIEMFNWNAKKGLNFLIGNKVLGNTPKEIAAFFLNTEGLNKRLIGEYLGSSDEFKMKTMHAFVDMLDFSELEFVAAIRKFLQSFWLPGEAQQIDRLMLKFAERYVGNNPNAFANADTAYVLAYSVIMLNVDQHNKKVKRKMTLEDFVRNNRGINDGKDLPEPLLRAIFEEISKNELKMKDEDHQQFIEGASKPKKETYTMETKDILKATQQLFKDRKKRSQVRIFYSAKRTEHAKPMFEVAWMPILVSISGMLQESDDPRVVNLCLSAFSSAIRIGSIFYLDLPRNTYVSTLAKFTYLTSDEKLVTMKAKHLAAMKLLVEIALRDGNYLRNSWQEVLQCISQLAKLQLLSERELNTLDRAAQNDPRLKRKSKLVDETAHQSMIVAVDRIFSSSVKLNGNAIVDFVQAMCAVSWEEIESSSNQEDPRNYLLQKIVEISYYNMNRIRLEWSRIWSALGEHFNKVGCHRNLRISTFAVDSLRQLSMKFLEKGELSHFQFQKDFLAPFVHIYCNNPVQIKDLVLRCLAQMIQATAQNIKSGWKTMLEVFGKAAQEPNANLVTLAFEAIKGITSSHFSAIVTHGSYNELIRCLVELARTPYLPKISLHAIELIRKCIPLTAELSAAQKELVITSSDRAEHVVVKEADNELKFWFPALFGLYEVIMSCELEVRTRASQYLIETLKKYGKDYSTSFWEVVFKSVLFPIFEDLDAKKSGLDRTEWLSTTCVFALRNVLELFNSYFDKISFLLDQMLSLLATFILHADNTLSRIGCSCLFSLMTANAPKLTEAMWDKIWLFIKGLFAQSNRPFPTPDLEASPDRAMAHAAILSAASRNALQLLILQTLNELFLGLDSSIYRHVAARHLIRLLDILESAAVTAREFDERLFRYALEREKEGDKDKDKEKEKREREAEEMAALQATLVRRRCESASLQVAVIFKMYGDSSHVDREEVRADVELRLLRLVKQLLDAYPLLLQNRPSEAEAWADTMAQLLLGIHDLSQEAFLRHLPVFYYSIVNLLAFDLQRSLREAIKTLLLRTGAAFNIALPRSR